MGLSPREGLFYIYRRYINERVAQYLFFFFLPEIFVCVRLCEREREREGEKKCMWIYKRMEGDFSFFNRSVCVCVYIYTFWEEMTLCDSSHIFFFFFFYQTKQSTDKSHNWKLRRYQKKKKKNKPENSSSSSSSQLSGAKKKKKKKNNLFLTDSIVPS